ncbi:MAG TPA: hypothetical protein PLD23_07010 [Armatimonadota bacterium]|nr:hypothetical protein [Armatimonadota bacterium]
MLALALALVLAPGSDAAPTPLANASFEELDAGGGPVGWRAAAWGRDGADLARLCGVAEQDDAPSGERVARMDLDAPTCTAWAQELKGLEPGQWYEASAMVRCQDLEGQGCHLNIEYWYGAISSGCLDAEHLVGTQGWTRQTLRFLAPGSDYHCNLSLFQIGGPGIAWFDDVTVRPIAPPEHDLSGRRALDEPLWGMFTCYANYLHQYGETMRQAGVHWQRQGLSALAPEQQAVAEKWGMSFEVCIDGMPPAADPADPLFPVTCLPDYEAMLAERLEAVGPSIRSFEFFNEPNTHLGWTLPAYADLIAMAGQTIKAKCPGVLIATGGFAPPGVGYAEACLKRDDGRVIDLVLLHPYAVDEALDAALFGLADACRRAGRPDVAVAINETGWPTWDPATGCDATSLFVSEEVQARNIVKLHLQALAHRLSFVTLLGWNDFTEPSDHARNMGLVRVDGSPKPSMEAYRFMTATIGSRRIDDWTYGPDGTRVLRFTGNPPLLVVWNALREADVALDVGDGRVFPCDIYGTRLTSAPVTGSITLRAGASPIYLVPA